MDLLAMPSEAAETSQPAAELSDEHDISGSDGQLFVALSTAAFAGTDGPRTMCFFGSIQNHDVLILVDSGSSHSFLSSAIADKLPGVQLMPTPIRVQVANGDVVQCSSFLPSASWVLQGYNFASDLRVLPLQHFDLILGMDWLESFSPMRVHWKSKWMSIPYGNSTVLLQGILPDVPADTLVQICSIAVAD